MRFGVSPFLPVEYLAAFRMCVGMGVEYAVPASARLAGGTTLGIQAIKADLMHQETAFVVAFVRITSHHVVLLCSPVTF